MKIKLVTYLIAFALSTATIFAHAHDPKEHMNDAEKPNCPALKGMDLGKMDMDDPVMQAMMKKCMKDVKNNDREHDHANVESGHGHEHKNNKTDTQHGGHQP